MPFVFDTTYARLPERFFARVQPTRVARPEVLAVNAALADLLHLTVDELTSPEGAEILAGNRLPPGADSIALAYAGHQFGGFVPQLGDGRAILLGEIVGRNGRRVDVQLKGPGRTPFSRGGDGRAALGPVLREYLVSEAMAALGVPTTRSLAAVATGERVYRETPLPGAVLTRVASSHIRVGTFQFFAARRDVEAVQTLTTYALDRHYPNAPRDKGPALTLLNCVIGAQAKLVAHWLSIGFVHGVMNTDNTSIAGETIDYGPCAFLDTYDSKRVFSSIDHGGRYAFSNQPRIAMWNLARLAETLLPIMHDDETKAVEMATELLETYPSRFEAEYATIMRKKLGFTQDREGDLAIAKGFLELLEESRVDFTTAFRRLADVADGAAPSHLGDLFRAPDSFLNWAAKWRSRLADEPVSSAERAATMRRVSPAFIPRNHRVEEMIAAAVEGDLKPFERLCNVLGKPYEDQPDAIDLTLPPGDEQWRYVTFCGT
ncbi:MAG: YdiU family protein [Polyangiaceae bacterium]|nr:YdiU family protein [Polyangiaceae bacterium]